MPITDGALKKAVDEGVESIILRSEMTMAARRELAHLLNKTHDMYWTVDRDGKVDISNVEAKNFSQFEAYSKVLDSEALTALVRLELGRGMDERTPAAAGNAGTMSRL